MAFTRLGTMNPDTSMVDVEVEGWEDWRFIFLKELRVTGNISQAAEKAGRSRVHAYQQKASDKNFSNAWDSAMQSAVDDLEGHAFTRAKKSDAILMFMLRSWRPETYGDKKAVFGAQLNDGTTVTLELPDGRDNSDLIEAIAEQLGAQNANVIDSTFTPRNGQEYYTETATAEDTERTMGNYPPNDWREDSQHESVREPHFTL